MKKIRTEHDDTHKTLQSFPQSLCEKCAKRRLKNGITMGFGNFINKIQENQADFSTMRKRNTTLDKCLMRIASFCKKAKIS